VEQLQIRLLIITPVGQTRHLKLAPIILPAGQEQLVPVQEKVVSMQLHVVIEPIYCINCTVAKHT
jgi:predicted membrane protein